MKKSIISLFLICIILMFSGCYLNVKYIFMNDTSEITSIEIVMLYEPEVKDTGFREEVIAVVENTDDFIQTFSKIHCERIIGQPVSMFPDTVVVRITYANGDYELINYDAQLHCYSDRNSWQHGFYELDKQEFKELIKQYYPPEELSQSKVSDLVDESNNP